MKTRHALFVCAIFLLCLFTACSPEVLMEDPETDAMMESALTALQNDDSIALFSLFVAEVLPDELDFSAEFARMREYLRGEVVSWEKISQNRNITNAVETVNCVYRVTTDQSTYLVNAIRLKQGEHNGLHTFNLIEENEYIAATQPRGQYNDLGRLNAVQWGLLVITVLTYVLIATTFVRCIRDSVRLKPLFLLLILLQLTLTLALTSNGFEFRFLVTMLDNSRWLQYPNGTNAFTVMVPLGAIIYWAVRKKVQKRVPPEDTAPRDPDQQDPWSQLPNNQYPSPGQWESEEGDDPS